MVLRGAVIAAFAALMAWGAVSAPVAAQTVAPPDEDQPLVADRSVVRAALANGMRYWIAPHPAAAGRAVIWMRVEAGALHEGEGEEGLAHFVEHMAFQGTRNYPRGSVTRRLEELGLTFGTDENAATTLRATTYKLALPQATPAALAEAVRIMADFAYRRDPKPADLERERGVILEEMRAADGYAVRVDDRVFAAAFAGTRAAGRMPIGEARVIEAAGGRELDRFMARWYRPERTTLLVSGDVDPAAVSALVGREFAAFRARAPAPAEPPALAAVPRGARALVITDPQQPFAELRLVRTQPPRPARTVGDFRRTLAARLALWMMNQRLRDAEDGGAAFEDAYAEIEPTVEGLADEAAVYGFARAGAWRGLLRALVVAVEGAGRAGFSDAELERARRALLGELRARAAGASTRPAAARVAEMAQAIATGQPLLSAARRLALSEQLAPLIDVGEVDAAFLAWFSAAGRLSALILPAHAGQTPPTRGQVARLAARAAAEGGARPRPASSVRVDALLDEEPRDGEVVDEATDPVTGITSATLANGVRLHVRPMHDRKDEVRVQVTLAGGELLETAATRGLGDAAALAFDTPATEKLSPAAIRSHLAERDVELSGCACDGDAITAELVAGSADLEKGMRLLHLVLTRGRITPAALQSWKDRALEWAAQQANDPELRVDADLAALLAGGDVRARPLTAAQIARVRLPAAQAWFDRQRASAPMEVAMVGDAPRDELLRLGRKYLGGLPARPPADERLAALRQPQVGALPGSLNLVVDSATPRAAIALAWRGPELADAADRDRLDLAAAVLNDRLRQELRVRRALTYAVSFDVAPAVAMHGTGALTVSLSTDPRRAREAARLARQVIERFAVAGPTPDELATARLQVESRRAAEAHKPAAWADRLAARDTRAVGSAAIADLRGDLGGIAADDVRATLARYVGAARAVVMVATPRSNLSLGGSAGRAPHPGPLPARRGEGEPGGGGGAALP